VLDYRENQVLSTVVPVFIDLFAEVELAVVRIDHRVVDLADEGDSWRTTRKLIKADSEFELRIFEKTVADEQHSMPN
jgi:hypothetical protein